MVQFGMNGDPKVNAEMQNNKIKDDPVKQSNTRGMITFATSGPNSRTSQVFINFGNNAGLDRQGFSPFGKIVEGMEVVDSLYKEYGEGAQRTGAVAGLDPYAGEQVPQREVSKARLRQDRHDRQGRVITSAGTRPVGSTSLRSSAS